MKEPIWIDIEDIHSFHEQMLAMHGGLPGVRDHGLLESALNRPRQLFNYAKPHLFEMAAAYATGIIKNHPFLDGNKRTGFLASAYFLELNGVRFNAAEDDVVIQTLALAAGESDEVVFATWLKKSSRRPRAPKSGYKA